MARTRAHPPRRRATAQGESEIAEARRPASPTPPPRRGLLSWGMPPAVGIVGPEDPRPQPSSRGGAHVDSRAPLIGLAWMSLVLAAFAGLPGSLPLPSRGGFRGYGRPGCRGSPPPATGSNNREQHSRAIGRRLDPGPPGPGGVPDEGQLLHHLRPSPPAPEPQAHRKRGPSTRNNQNTGI